MLERDNFTLLDSLKKQESADKVNLEIEQLRLLARRLISANNPLVQALWEIDIKMAQPGKQYNDAELTKLLANKTKLQQELDEENYAQQIKDTLEKIKKLEINYLGHSELDSHSPYPL